MASASSGDLSSENQRPIICLNNSYKWFTSSLQIPLDIHLTHTTWWKGNREGRRLNVAESHTTSSLTRWWPRIVIEVNGLWAWHGSMWRKHMVPWTKRGSPKWWTYSDYPVGYAMELHEQLTPTKVYSAYKTRTSTLNDVTCRLCGNPQTFWHMYRQVAQALLRQSTWKDTTLHWRCYSLRCLNNTSSLILFLHSLQI